MVQYTESRPVSMRGVDCKYPRRTSNVVNRPSRLVQTRCRHNSRFFSYYKFPTYFVFCQSWWSPIPTRTAPKGLGSRGMDGRRKIPILLTFACPLDVCAVITPMPITATSDDNLDLSQTVDMGARSQAGLFRLKLTTPGLFPPPLTRIIESFSLRPMLSAYSIVPIPVDRLTETTHGLWTDPWRGGQLRPRGECGLWICL